MKYYGASSIYTQAETRFVMRKAEHPCMIYEEMRSSSSKVNSNTKAWRHWCEEAKG